MNNQNDPKTRSIIRRYSLLAALGCALVVFIVYLGALKSGFVNWDDNSLVYSNPNIRSLDPAFIKWAFTHVVIASWYPLTLISFAMDYALWGLDPTGYHLTNNLLHALNTALVFFFVLKLFFHLASERKEAPGPGGSGNLFRGAVACAMVTALLFGLHPLRVESVAWVAERKDVLYAFFYLLSLIAYCSYRGLGFMPGAQRQRLFYLLSLVFFASSLMSKAMAVSLPLVLVIIDLYIYKVRSSGAAFKLLELIKDKIPFFLLSIIFSIFTLFTHGESGTLVSLEVHSPLARLLLTFREYIFYMVKTVIPAGLAPFYPLPSSIQVFTFEYIGSILIFSAVTALSVYFIKKKSWLAAAWAYYVVTLLPVTGLFSIGAHAGADRYTYLPSLGLLILPGLIAGAVFMRPGIRNIKLLAVAAAVVVLVVSGALTQRQIGIWKDSVTLWSYEIDIYPERVPVAYINLGNAYDDLVLKDEALSAYKKALSIDPDNTVAHNNLGFLYQERGAFDLALKHYEAALVNAKRPAYIRRVLENTGDLLLSSSRGAEAVERYQKALETEGLGADAGLLNKLGIALATGGRIDEARRSFQRALELNPAHVGARKNLSRVKRQQ